jgi:hypothetical protein
VNAIHLTIISGQTGADRAALDFAIARGLPHGGWCPNGRLAEDGTISDRYRLKGKPALLPRSFPMCYRPQDR